MTIASWGFVPALAAGNAVLVKPAEITPLTTMRLAELGLEAGLPDGLFQVLPGKGSVVGERFISHPDVRKIVFTGSTEVGVKVMAGAAAAGQAGHAGTRRQEREHRLRRLRPGEGRRHRAVRRVRQRRPGLLRAQPNPGAAQRLRQVHGAARTRGQGCGRRRSGVTGQRDGAAGVQAALRHRVVVRARRRARRLPRIGADGARILVPANGSHPAAHRPHGHRGDLRAGRHRAAVRATRPTRSSSPTTARTACPGRSGPTTCRGRCGCRARWNPATCR